MSNLIFGKYIPYNSLIHNADPRTKIIALFFLMIAIFIPAGWYGYLFLSIVLIIAALVSHIKAKMIIQAFKPMLFMMIFLLVINIFSVKTGTLWFEYGFISIYADAVINTLYIAVRLVLMIMLTTLLTATTKPLELTLGLEYLMSPLSSFIPSHEIAMMISIALRFIPTIIEETMRIMNAQKSRGVDFEEGKLKEKVTAILSLIIPLFSVAFQRADDLADAMEARGYCPGEERTRYKELHYHVADYLIMGIYLLCLAANIGISFLL